MTITSTVAIDLVDRDRYPLAQVYAKQDDSLSRAIAASIYAAGVAWVPPSGATAVIRYRRPDGIGGIYDELPDGSVAYTIADNVITAYIAPDALSCPGRVRMDIVIVNGTEALATFDISVLVDAAPTSGVAPTNGYYKYKTLADINAALAARVQSVNNQAPDNKGNVQINAEQTGAVSRTAFDAAMTTVVRKVNGVTPDSDGNVNVSGGSGGNVLSVNSQTGAVQIPTPASGVCSIGADIPAKVVESVSPGASPTHGALVYVKFEAANTAGNPTLTFMGYTAPIVDGDGNAVAPGALTAGTHGFQRRGETWVLLDALYVDTSLTISGKAADAKATGDALRSLSGKIANYKPVAKTTDMTNPVGVDENGQLWTAPTSNNSADTATKDTLLEMLNGFQPSEDGTLILTEANEESGNIGNVLELKRYGNYDTEDASAGMYSTVYTNTLEKGATIRVTFGDGFVGCHAMMFAELDGVTLYKTNGIAITDGVATLTWVASDATAGYKNVEISEFQITIPEDCNRLAITFRRGTYASDGYYTTNLEFTTWLIDSDNIDISLDSGGESQQNVVATLRVWDAVKDKVQALVNGAQTTVLASEVF